MPLSHRHSNAELFLGIFNRAKYSKINIHVIDYKNIWEKPFLEFSLLSTRGKFGTSSSLRPSILSLMSSKERSV